MLGRYRIHRGKRPAGDPLPEGVRQDTRKHTKHPLRPPASLVVAYLNDPTEENWWHFERTYLDGLERRFREDRRELDALADRARRENVFLGCNCPTSKNPDVRRCHTVLALRFMKSKYPDLDVEFPGSSPRETLRGNDVSRRLDP